MNNVIAAIIIVIGYIATPFIQDEIDRRFYPERFAPCQTISFEAPTDL